MGRLAKLLARICVAPAQDKRWRCFFPLQNYPAAEGAAFRMITAKERLALSIFSEQTIVIDERYPISSRVSHTANARCGQTLSGLMDHP